MKKIHLLLLTLSVTIASCNEGENDMSMLALLALASAASSDATGDSYLRPLKTGQTASYETGDDGDVQAGRDADFTGPVQHDTYTSDYTTTDNATGLVWKSCTEGQTGSDCQGTGSSGDNYGADSAKETWANAITACTDLNSEHGSGNGYAGRTDWRLPTIAELETIIKYDGLSPSTFQSNFPATVDDNTVDGKYWSASANDFNTSEAWWVWFKSGAVNVVSKTPNSYYVRCVSGGFSQSSGYTDNSDGTVTDKDTGLIWQKCIAGLSGTDCSSGTEDEPNWADALSYCNDLTLAGRSDWRLPNINELKSIVDRSTSTPAIDTTAFPNADGNTYWSATTATASSVGQAWRFWFAEGVVTTDTKSTGSNRVRCVTSD